MLFRSDGEDIHSHGLTGEELISIGNLADLSPRSDIEAQVTMADGSEKTLTLRVRIDTEDELTYFRHGGILHYVLRQLAGAA